MTESIYIELFIQRSLQLNEIPQLLANKGKIAGTPVCMSIHPVCATTEVLI